MQILNSGRPYIAKCKKCNQIFEFPASNKDQVCTECQRVLAYIIDLVIYLDCEFTKWRARNE